MKPCWVWILSTSLLFTESKSLIYISKEHAQHQNTPASPYHSIYTATVNYLLAGLAFQSTQAKVMHNLRNAAIQRAPAKPTQDLDKKPPQTAPRKRRTAPTALRLRSALSVMGAVKSFASLIISQYKLVNTTVGIELYLRARLATIWPALWNARMAIAA